MTDNEIKFRDNRSLAGREARYAIVTVQTDTVLKSWRDSLFSFEWLTSAGTIRGVDDLPIHERDKRLEVEKNLRSGQMLERPVLGIGLLDNVEIGAGREIFLTLADHGHESIEVHIPVSSLREFEPYVAERYMGDGDAMRRRTPQDGSVFFLILVGIALFAGLSYAVFSNSRSSATSLSKDQARLAANEIINYGEAIAQSVQSLRLRGCGNTEISLLFGPFTTSGNFNNTFSPTDKSCYVFDPAGGKITSKTADTSWTGDTSNPYSWTANAYNNHSGIGGNGADLVLMLINLKKEICVEINRILNVGSPGSDPESIGTYADINGWSGAFAGSPANITSSVLAGKSAMCLYDSGDATKYKFVRILIAN